MASLYQRFTGKINTTNSFPHPPEASHLLGGQVADEENATKTPQQLVDGKPHVQYRKKCLQEDEDVRTLNLLILQTWMTNLQMYSSDDFHWHCQTHDYIHTQSSQGLQSPSLEL